jgi:hypothetical protein
VSYHRAAVKSGDSVGGLFNLDKLAALGVSICEVATEVSSDC